MEIIITNTPDINLINSLSDIVQQCVDYDGMFHPSYLEIETPFFPDFRHYYVAIENGMPVAFISIFTADGFCAQCYAFTLPNYRKKGYFEALFSKVRDEILYYEYETMIFPILPQNQLAQTVIAKYGGYKDCCECILKYDISNIPQSCNKPGLTLERQEYNGHISYKLALNSIFKNKIIGSCNVDLACGCCTIYDFEIKKSKRNKGFGTLFLKMVLADIINNGNNTIILHVSTKNTIAYNMYLQNNFFVHSSLEMWNIDIKKSIL